ncbi:extracellular solute-binding protein [Roseicyclus persicicus]|uniref:ABC transporter substrate-binding protein n=1 Tax=Roseicyclus persicicus TaxID=2650661 RepID=A0A7X6JYN4_9RHOB|nr:extracellular solute-binding protein [Roseibacterium persicicum]NKX46020.1 ABC transporter substrate-binding protein [Roseibacterium persicicum]
MTTKCFRSALTGVLLSLGLAGAGMAEPVHGIAMYGEPALPPDYTHLPYANPDAPTGGRIVTGEVGAFDSLNPHIRQGSVPWQLRHLAYESLLGRSWDEPFTLYGLLAESVEVAEDNSWVEFTLRPEARFSDGSPVTVTDVIWSFETLGTVGHPRYLGAWTRVSGIEAVGERGVRITFAEPDRELAMIMGLRPILQAAQWEGIDFEASGLDVIPITTAPYVVDDFEAGRFLSLRRDPDYWGADLPFRRGTNVIDEIRMEFFADGTAMFEAFTAGILTTMRETSAQAWATNYDFPRVRSGEVVLSEVPHQRPSGMTGLVMNTRDAPFSDWRVREAMIQAFPAEFINQTLNAGVDPRITSYFANSPLAMRPGPAEGRVAEFLAEYEQVLLPGAIEGYVMPVSDGTERNRQGIATALEALAAAGYTVQNGVMTTPEGAPFTFEILLQTGSSENDAIVNIYTEALMRLGIAVQVTRVDAAQFRERRDAFDFDMIYERYGLSLSPGNEQYSYWGCEVVDTPGSRNLMGACHPAIEGLIGRMLTSESQDDYVAAVQALDRVLTSMRYVVPFWHNPFSRIAYNAELHYPETIPIYGDWIGWQPDVWWVEQ